MIIIQLHNGHPYAGIAINYLSVFFLFQSLGIWALPWTAYPKLCPHRLSWCLVLLIAGPWTLDEWRNEGALPEVSTGARSGCGRYLAHPERRDGEVCSLLPQLRTDSALRSQLWLRACAWSRRELTPVSGGEQGVEGERTKELGGICPRPGQGGAAPKSFQESEALTRYCGQSWWEPVWL